MWKSNKEQVLKLHRKKEKNESLLSGLLCFDLLKHELQLSLTTIETSIKLLALVQPPA